MTKQEVCAECNNFFQLSDQDESPIQKCPQCVEKLQDEMLRIMFGDAETE